MNMIGKIKWFNDGRGFGFVNCPELNADIFIHFSAIKRRGFKTLKENQIVEFELLKTEKGYQAVNVCEVKEEVLI